jgi:hypothetical protein
VLSAVRVLVNLASAPPAATTLARDVCPVLMAALGAVDESSGVAATAAVTAFQRSVPLLQLVAAFVANLAHHRRCIPELLKHRVCGPLIVWMFGCDFGCECVNMNESVNVRM